jgi:hypothetical protein
MKLLSNFCLFLSLLSGSSSAALENDLHLFSIPGTSSRTMICFHGYGANYQIAEDLKKLGLIDATLVSFNFPDHDLQQKAYDPHQLTFGTIQELLPAFSVLKKYVIEEGLETIDLYGFSAGGGAVVNLIAVLNTPTYDTELELMGIGKKEKKQLLKAIQKGLVILDAPLKSVEEILECRGASPELEILAGNYQKNNFRPIDALKSLEGLSINVILYFQEPDEVVFNRDDLIYIERLQKANPKGTISVIIGNEGGHSAPHLLLWNTYSQKINP